MFRASVYLFFGSAAYIFLKRFYLNEMISLIFWIIGSILGLIFQTITRFSIPKLDINSIVEGLHFKSNSKYLRDDTY